MTRIAFSVISVCMMMLVSIACAPPRLTRQEATQLLAADAEANASRPLILHTAVGECTGGNGFVVAFEPVRADPSAVLPPSPDDPRDGVRVSAMEHLLTAQLLTMPHFVATCAAPYGGRCPHDLPGQGPLFLRRFDFTIAPPLRCPNAHSDGLMTVGDLGPPELTELLYPNDVTATVRYRRSWQLESRPMGVIRVAAHSFSGADVVPADGSSITGEFNVVRGDDGWRVIR